MDNGDKALPELYIELGGQRHKLVANFGTFRRFEERSGKNAMDTTLWEKPSATDVITLIWAALGGESSGKTVEQVGDLLEMYHLHDVGHLMRRLFGQASLSEDQKKMKPVGETPTANLSTG